jgi:hypothetical protein
MLYTLLGIIIGMLIRDIKFQTIKLVDKSKEKIETMFKNETSQFVEPVSFRDKFDEATSIDDLLDNN